jgi:omega-amidase
MDKITVTFIQTSLYWEDPVKNIQHFRNLFDRIGSQSDLILLPEMFNTGFSINPMVCAEEMDGPSVRFLLTESTSRNVVIMATLLIRDKDQFYNRLVCISPDGSIQTYDKRHLFRLSEEYRIINAGNSRKIFDVNGWKIMPLICYDLRFPVWTKNSYQDGRYEYDALVCLANWPQSRQHVWETLLKARAMENQSYAIGVNRIGMDGHGTDHSGDSMAVDARGNVMMKAAPGKEVYETLSLSYKDLLAFRESFTLGMDWDQFSLNLT